MIKVGDKVQHVKTKRIGTVLPFVPMPSETYVHWDGTDKQELVKNGDLTQPSATIKDLFRSFGSSR